MCSHKRHFYCRSVPIVSCQSYHQSAQVPVANRNRTIEKNSSVRTHVCLIDASSHELHAEKNNVAIDETCVFACSNEVFKSSASSCV